MMVVTGLIAIIIGMYFGDVDRSGDKDYCVSETTSSLAWLSEKFYNDFVSTVDLLQAMNCQKMNMHTCVIQVIVSYYRAIHI